MGPHSLGDLHRVSGWKPEPSVRTQPVHSYNSWKAAPPLGLRSHSVTFLHPLRTVAKWTGAKYTQESCCLGSNLHAASSALETWINHFAKSLGPHLQSGDNVNGMRCLYPWHWSSVPCPRAIFHISDCLSFVRALNTHICFSHLDFCFN